MWKNCLQVFGHSFSLLTFQKASSSEMIGDVGPALLTVPAAAVGLPAAESFAWGR